MTARQELESRATLVALTGEYVGTTPLLCLLRIALDEYADAQPDPESRVRLTADHELVGRRVHDERRAELMPTVRGALSLYNELRHDPDEALRVLRAIEQATEQIR